MNLSQVDMLAAGAAVLAVWMCGVTRVRSHPVLLLTECDGVCDVSAAHKRWSQGEAGQTVLDGPVIAAEGDPGEYWPAFREALGLGRQLRSTMLSVYQGWVDTLLALHAARVTGRFVVPVTRDQAAPGSPGRGAPAALCFGR